MPFYPFFRANFVLLIEGEQNLRSRDIHDEPR